MAIIIVALVVGLYLLRRWAKPKTIITRTEVKQYRPDRAQFQRVPGRRRTHRGL